MSAGSILDLPIDVWLLILDEIHAQDYSSLRGTCKQLDKFIAPIPWGKLELVSKKVCNDSVLLIS
jgi:hypothetical protein